MGGYPKRIPAAHHVVEQGSSIYRWRRAGRGGVVPLIAVPRGGPLL